ncbi:unnamed protein product [Calypogeia fissa]
MKGGTVQILWHGSDPILSVDFHLPTGLLATAGADRDIKLWSLHRTEKSKAIPSATFKANLSYHGAAVNVVRFSPSGELLASGADNGELLIWRITQTDEEIPTWKVWKTLRFHHKDVLDLGWSPDGAFLVSGSVDNTSIIWNVEKGIVEQVLADHQHYVQGVTWDPAGKYVASLSGDRTCRIYSMRSPSKKSRAKDKNVRSVYTCQHVLCKKEVSAGSLVATTMDADEASQKQLPSSKQYLFYDENMPSFFRRLSWSPDGSFLLLPSGVEKQSPDAGACSVSYIVSRNDLSRPALQLPAASKPVVAARFCPVVYSLSPKKSWKHDTTVPGVGAFKFPYRLVFAVATLNSVFIYDTEQSCPIAIFGGLHYAPITDLAWSFDGKFLAVSSQDGYCTLVGFDEGDLGTPLPPTDLPSKIGSLLPDSRFGSIQLESSIVSPVKDPSETRADPSSEKDPAATEKSSHKKQAEIHVKPQKIRRVNPKPISEYLQKQAVSPPESRIRISNSGGLSIQEECLSSSEVQGNQSNAEVPRTVTQVAQIQSDTERCSRVDGDKRLDGMESTSGGVSNSGSAQASTPACEAVGKEISETWESCSTAMEGKSGICRMTEIDKMVELSRKDAQGLPEPVVGLSATPLLEDHHRALGVGKEDPCKFEKPRDPYADIYVRPLKFRRISPKLINDDIEKPSHLKPLSSETSFPLPGGRQALQPT